MSNLLNIAFVGKTQSLDLGSWLKISSNQYGYLLPLKRWLAGAVSSGAFPVPVAVRADSAIEDSDPEDPPLTSELSEEQYLALSEALRAHLLALEDLVERGFPLSYRPGYAWFYVAPPPLRSTHFCLRVDASPYEPTTNRKTLPRTTPISTREVVELCCRCYKRYHMTEYRDYITLDACVYHPTRPRGGLHACCGAVDGAGGCSTAPRHVCSGSTPGFNGPASGFVQTTATRGGVYSIDVEMVYTSAGLEAGSVALVALDGRLAYGALVKPSRPVVDHNTPFSGLDAATLARADKSLAQVQSELLLLVGADTVLVGHGLENDLRALKLVHGCVVDTSAMFPHARGWPLRRSLRALAREVLGREVQAAQHDPLEDARAALDLALLGAGVEWEHGR